eukprot:816217-Rhodomonas_salina.1
MQEAGGRGCREDRADVNCRGAELSDQASRLSTKASGLSEQASGLSDAAPAWQRDAGGLAWGARVGVHSFQAFRISASPAPSPHHFTPAPGLAASYLHPQHNLKQQQHLASAVGVRVQAC